MFWQKRREEHDGVVVVNNDDDDEPGQMGDRRNSGDSNCTAAVAEQSQI